MKLKHAQRNLKRRTSLLLAVLMTATVLMGPAMQAFAEEDGMEEPAPVVVETAEEQEAPVVEAEPSEEPAPTEEPAPSEEPAPTEEPAPSEEPVSSETSAPAVEPEPTVEPVQDPEAVLTENNVLNTGTTETKFADQAEGITLYRVPSQNDHESVGAAGGEREIYPAGQTGRVFRSFQPGNAETVNGTIAIASPLYLDTQYDPGMVLPFESWTVTVLQTGESFIVTGAVLELDAQALIQKYQISKWTTGVEITANWGEPVSLESLTGEPEETTYSVTFKYRDPTGEWTYSEPQKVKEGEAAQAPDIPKRPTAYIFKNWDKSFDHITADTEISAKYTRVQNVYTVNFYLSDKLLEAGYYYEGTYQLQGSIYDSHSYAGGSYCTLEGVVSQVTPAFTVRPKGPHAGDNLWGPYVFTVMDMTGGKYNGQTIASPVPDSDYGALGFYEMDRRSDFEKHGFKKKDVINISVDMINDPTVTFVDENGNQIGEAQTLTWGTSATAPEMEEGVFDHWELTPAGSNLDCVRTDITAKAVVKEYTATFLQPDGTEIASQKVKVGEEIVPPTVAGGNGYHFKYWTENKKNQEVKFPQTMGKEDRTFTAKYGGFENTVGDLYVNDVKVGSVDLTESFLKNMLDAGAPGVYTGENGMFSLQPLVYANGSDLNNERKFGISWNVRDFSADSKVFQDAGYTFTSEDKTAQVNEIAWEGVEYTSGSGAWKIYAHMEIPVREYKVTYYLADELKGSYVLSNSWAGSNFGEVREEIKNTDDRITAFGVVLNKWPEKGIVTAVTMTLKDDVTGTFGGEEVTYSAGTQISYSATVSNGSLVAKVHNDFAHTLFPADAQVNIIVNALSHSVTFVGEDGRPIKTEQVVHGMAATAPDAPEVQGKKFTGWDRSFDSVTEDITVKAQYQQLTYTVNYILDEELQDSYVLKNNGQTMYTSFMNAYTPITSFGVWIKDKNTGAQNMAVSMELQNDVEGYQKNSGEKMNFAAGTLVSTFRDGRAYVNYENGFGHTKFAENTVLNIKVSAVKHEVKFVNADGVPLDIQNVIHGMAASAPADPEMPGKTFTNWDRGFSNVTENMTVTAVYDTVLYTVTFLDENGREVAVRRAEYGHGVEAPEAPVVEGKTFTKWDSDFSYITRDLTVRAVYSVNTYTVTFVGENGKGLKTETVEHGKAATAPEAPRLPGKRFQKWDTDFTAVTSDLTVKAVYRKIPADNGGNEPDDPTGPVNPDVPEGPETPTTPDTPTTPETPNIPDTPATPETPVEPAAPVAPATPAAPVTTTPVAAPGTENTVAPAAEPEAQPATVTIPDEPVPLANVGDQDENGYTLTTISDEQVPLAGSAPEAHQFCILHFLILLMSLLLEIVYVFSRNRNQKKLQELRREVEQEQ